MWPGDVACCRPCGAGGSIRDITGEDQAKAASVTLEGTFDLPLQADGG